jgi:hypothetical protein
MVTCRCQLHCLQKLAEGDLPDSPNSPWARLKLFLKRRFSPARKRQSKLQIGHMLNIIDRLRGRKKTGPEAAPPLNLDAGDWVRVRPEAEIRATLDHFSALNGCGFMPEMVPYCGQTLRVFKPVGIFLDERDYKLKKASGLVLLEDAICEGTALYGRCDRCCFFFWREEWLERAPAPAEQPTPSTHDDGGHL